MVVAAAASSSSSKSNKEGRNKTTKDPACRILFQKDEDDDQGASSAINYNSTSSSSKKRRDASVHSNTTSAGTSDNSHSTSNHTTPSRKRNKIRLVTPSSSSTTPATPSSSTSVVVVANKPPPAKRTLAFGREINLVQSPPNVTAVYKLVRKLTGSIGGNGCVGPIYGELTQASMQKIINLMVDVTGFATTSRFLDVGSGIGKPNLHVAQYPGVEFSCGIEMEYSRWLLGMTCLKACLTAAVTAAATNPAPTSSAMAVQGKTMFVFDTITKARTFDPFTHVYMFSIGFPPDLWEKLATMWNRSDSSACHYLICYAGPKHIIEDYTFAVELVAQTTTSMHGSSESHMGYVYRRTPIRNNKNKKKKGSRATTRIVSCDPLFKPSYDLVKSGLTDLKNTVDRQMEKEMGGGEGESRRITTRSQRTTDLSKRY